jgi:hypothetical protein
MKLTVVTAALLVYSAASNGLTVDEFQQQCSSDPSYCRGYIRGVPDTRTSWILAYERDPAHPKEESQSLREEGQSQDQKMDLRGLPWIPAKFCNPGDNTYPTYTGNPSIHRRSS